MIKKLIKKLKKLVKKINKRMVAKIHKLTQPPRPRRKIGRPLGAKDKVKRKSPRKMDLTGLALSLRCGGTRPIIEDSADIGEPTQKEMQSWAY